MENCDIHGKWHFLLKTSILKNHFYFTPSPKTIRQLVGFKNILRSIESYGIASVHGINYFGRGLLSSDKYVDYIRHDILGMDLLNTTINYVPSVKKDYKRIAAMPGFGSLQNW